MMLLKPAAMNAVPMPISDADDGDDPADAQVVAVAAGPCLMYVCQMS